MMPDLVRRPLAAGATRLRRRHRVDLDRQQDRAVSFPRLRRRARQPSPGEEQALRHAVPPRDLAHHGPRRQGLFDDPRLLVPAPAPSALDPENLPIHLCLTLRLALRSHLSRRFRSRARRPPPDGYDNCLTAVRKNRGVRVSDPTSHPEIRGDRSFAARDGMHSARSGPAKAERERRVVEGLRGGPRSPGARGSPSGDLRRRARNRNVPQAPGKPQFRSRNRTLSHPGRGLGAGSCARQFSGRRFRGRRSARPAGGHLSRSDCSCRRARRARNRNAPQPPWKVSIREPGQQPPSPLVL